jgi:outer membrane protein assembly factor BamB
MMNKVVYSLWVLFASLTLSCSQISVPTPKGVKPQENIFQAKWIKNHDPIYNTGNLPVGLGAPLIHAGVVYVGHDDAGLKAYSLRTGRLLWHGKEKQRYHAGPVAYDDQVIYGTVEGRVVSRHSTTGEIKYEIDLGSSVESQGVVSNGRLLFHLRNHQLFCLDVETGKILWAYKRAVPYLTTLQRASRPLVHENKVFVGFADGYAAAFSLEDGLLLWEQRLSSGTKFVDVDTDPLIIDGQLYMGPYTSTYSILDPKTGNVLHKLNHTLSRAAVPFDEKLILGTQEGKVVTINRQLRELQSTQLDGAVTSLKLWKKYLVAGTTSGKVYALDPQSLEIQEVFELGHAHSSILAPFQVSDETLVIMSSRNRIYAF